MPARIHVAGGSGSGKSTLARRLGDLLDVPVHHLDDVAREPGTGRLRPMPERLDLVSRIAASPRWVTDGIHVGWTDELCRRADVIVWLDQVAWPTAALRVVRRFAAGAIGELRRRRGLRRSGGVRSYGRHLAELFGAIREIRAYDAKPAVSEPGDAGSRAATAAQLKPYAAKVIHCRGRDSIDRYVAVLERRVGGRPIVGDPAQ